jgi:predicted O-methyltransferase YrrM
MVITNKLLELDPSLVLHNEGEWSKTISEYSAFNDGGVECEVGEFLYALTRMLKPNFVLETGTHHGVGGSYIGLALKDSSKGILDTIEFLPENYRIAKQRFDKMALNQQIVAHYGDVKDFAPQHNYQLILLDTEPQTRFAELEKFYPFLDEGGFLFIHDLNRHVHQIPNEEHGFAWPYGPVTEFMKLKVVNDELRPFHFSTPRGLTGFYKVSQADYKWKM